MGKKRRRILISLALVLGVLATVGLRFDLPAEDVDARYRTADSHFETLADGTRLHYWDVGRKNAPVIVLLHGSYDSAYTWSDWLPHLKPHFRVIVPDLPGHGLTGQTAADAYDIPGMVSAVHQLADKLQLPRFHLAGNSMGGNTAWRYALAHPQRVERMVLIDASGYPGLGSHTPKANNFLTRWLVRNGNPALLIARGFRRAVADSTVINDGAVERSVSFLRRAGSRDAQAKRARTRKFDGQPVDRLGTLSHPTLVLWGQKDALIPFAHASRFEKDLPHARLISYPDLGHMPQLEDPERSVKDALTFLLSDRAVRSAENFIDLNAASNVLLDDATRDVR